VTKVGRRYVVLHNRISAGMTGSIVCVVLLEIRHASVSGKDIADEMMCCSLYCHGVCSSFIRLKTSMQCGHLVVYNYTDILVIITSLSRSGDYSSMQEEREDLEEEGST
jgi:hypothetical protein